MALMTIRRSNGFCGRIWKSFRDLLIISTIFIALVEIALRLVTPQQIENRLYYLNWTSAASAFSNWDDDFTYRHPPLSEFRHKTADYDVLYHTDENGFRLVDNSAVSSDAPTLMLLGDSFVFGSTVDDRQTFAQHIADEGVFRVINTGQSGYGTVSELLMLRQYKASFSPKLVMLFIGSNDYGDNFDGYKPQADLSSGRLRIKVPGKARRIFDTTKREYESGRGFYTKTEDVGFRRALRGYLLRHSRFVLGLDVLYGEAKKFYAAARKHPPSPIDDRQADTMERLLEIFDRESKESGAEFVVVQVAERGFVSFADYPFRAHPKKTCERLSIPYIDLNDFFAKVGKERKLFHPHDGHWTAAGHELVAETLLVWLREHRELWGDAALH